MTKRMLLLACTLLLGGCALPVPVQIASWAVDGLLYITTEKTMIDHGVSIAAARDCAMLRVVTEGALCRDNDAVTMLASADAPTAVSDVPPLAGDDTAERLALFETAAGGKEKPEPLETAYLALDSEEPPVHAEAEAAQAADWQAIIEVALFIERLLEPARSEALSGSASEWTSILPSASDDDKAVVPGLDVGLLLIGGDEREYADGADGLAIRGDAGTDALRGASAAGGADRDRNPPPVRDGPRACNGPPGHARRRPPRRSLGAARGRGPPVRRGRRVHDPHVRERGRAPFL